VKSIQASAWLAALLQRRVSVGCGRWLWLSLPRARDKPARAAQVLEARAVALAGVVEGVGCGERKGHAGAQKKRDKNYSDGCYDLPPQMQACGADVGAGAEGGQVMQGGVEADQAGAAGEEEGWEV